MGHQRFCFHVLFTALLYLTLTVSMRAEPADPVSDSLVDPTFGQLTVIRHKDATPKGAVLLLAPGAVRESRWRTAATEVAGLNYLVALIDSTPYLDRLAHPELPCADVAADLATLAAVLADRYELPHARSPILLGFEQGAALSYAALTQSFPGQFHTAVSVNFCPRLNLPEPLCAESGLHSTAAADGRAIDLAPVKRLSTDWFVFQGVDATDCPTNSSQDFVAQIPAAKQTVLPGPALDNSALSPQITALLNWLDPRIKAQIQLAPAIAEVPLIEARAAGGNKLLAVMLSGDGGWAKLDRSVADELNAQGVSVVGWDTLSYFWDKKTPDQAADDLTKVLNYYLDAWDKEQVLLIGYSFGADVLPFMLNRMTPELRPKVALVTLLGLSARVAFEFHLSNWLGDARGSDTLAVPPEIAKLTWAGRLCIYGAAESDSACPGLDKVGVTVLKVPGDHHFGDDYQGLTEQILKHLSR